MINDFLDTYPYDAPEVLLLETISNSIDVFLKGPGSTIAINLAQEPNGDVTYSIKDDGKGMTREDFENNYHALALSSKIKGEGIGFAGMGAKLYLACLSSGQKIITETKTQDGDPLASELTLLEGEPKWRYIRPSIRERGTQYSVILDPLGKAVLNTNTVKKLVQKHFNALLMEGKVTVLVDNQRVEPSMPHYEKESAVSFRIKDKTYSCGFWLASYDVERPGVEIAVFGKSIRAGEYFQLNYVIKPSFRDRIYGIIRADGLALLLNTSKTDFKQGINPQLYGTFRKAAFDVFKSWLESIDAIQAERKERSRYELAAMEQEISHVFDVVFKDPALLKYNPFLRTRIAKTSIPSVEGDVPATLGQGQQEVAGDSRGGGEGGGVATSGPEQGASLKKEEMGRTKAREVERRIRTGIKVNWTDQPADERQAWFTPEAVVINEGHPTYKKSKNLGFYAEEQNTLRCIFLALLEAFPPPTAQEALQDINRFYAVWGAL